MATSKRITNEFGKGVTIDVSQGILRQGMVETPDGLKINEIGPMVQIEMTGPDSQTDNIVTYTEAGTLRDALIEEMWREITRTLADGEALMRSGPLSDTERAEAVILRVMATTGIGRPMVLNLLRAMVEALHKFDIVLAFTPKAIGYLTTPQLTTGGYVDGSSTTPPSDPVSGGESPHGHGIRAADVIHDPDADITDPRV